MAASLERTTFTTSREMDFFSRKELTTQTGHGIHEWPIVAIKELTDNALDACESADIAPVITITCDAEGITVSDNGPGIPADTLQGALDFSVRASNREMYVAPDRGAQGNALMTLLSMPHVIDPECGCLIVEAHGMRHRIVCRADPITQRAVIHDDTEDVPDTPGTTVRIQWSECIYDDGDIAWPFDDKIVVSTNEYHVEAICRRTTELVRGYAMFNPHLEVTFDWFGDVTHFKATNTDWKKWKPNKPTSPHWYEPQHLSRLIAAYITYDREREDDRTVSAFLAEFDGLTGTAKRRKVLDETDMARIHLSQLVKGDDLDGKLIAKLLASMKKHTKEVKPPRLGVIGKDHISQRIVELGCVPDSIEYKKFADKDGLPYVAELAFGYLGEDADCNRSLITGANWSAAIHNPFRSFGATGQGLEGFLASQYAGIDAPVVFVCHLAHPRVEYTDRGKSALVLANRGES